MHVCKCTSLSSQVLLFVISSLLLLYIVPSVMHGQIKNVCSLHVRITFLKVEILCVLRVNLLLRFYFSWRYHFFFFSNLLIYVSLNAEKEIDMLIFTIILKSIFSSTNGRADQSLWTGNTVKKRKMLNSRICMHGTNRSICKGMLSANKQRGIDGQLPVDVCVCFTVESTRLVCVYILSLFFSSNISSSAGVLYTWSFYQAINIYFSVHD